MGMAPRALRRQLLAPSLFVLAAMALRLRRRRGGRRG
jgi:hypothetical protein